MFDQRFTINNKFAPEIALTYIKLYNEDETKGREMIQTLLNKTFGQNDELNSKRLTYIEKNIKSLCQMVDNYIQGTLSLKNLPLEMSNLLMNLAKQME